MKPQKPPKSKLSWYPMLRRNEPEPQDEEFIEMDEYGHVEILHVEPNLPKWWWWYPTFDFGLHYPMPYIWFAYWLITWEEDEFHPFTMFTLQWKYKKYRTAKAMQAFTFLRISIDFMPD